MKKLFAILLTAMMVFGIAGTAAATFEDGNLVAVFYNQDDNTVAFDLGAVVPGSDYTVDTSNLLDYFETVTDYTDISVGIFANTEAYSYWFATTSSDQANMSTSSIASFNAATTNLYGTYSAMDSDSDGISVLAASSVASYDTVMNSNSNAPGYYAGYNSEPTIGEAVLTAEGDFTMYVHHFTGVTYKGDDLLTVSTSTVPVPGAVWLMATGLLGFLGVRRKNA